MTSGWLCKILALGSLVLVALPIHLTGQQQSVEQQQLTHTRYVVTDLGTLQDGPASFAFGLNDSSVINGASILTDGTFHAALWHRKFMVDLATPGLGGLNSEAFGVNERGQASGLAETSEADPNGEDFCGFGTFVMCRPFIWQRGLMKPLPTLGGNNGEAGQINDLGEVAGNAENRTLDLTCPASGPQRFQNKPVVWKNGKAEELPTFDHDPDGWTFGINNRGQIVGASGVCSSLNPQTGVYILSRHALLWDEGKLTNLGNLGGTGAFGPGNIGGEINSRGEVAGTSDLPGDTTFHAFRWSQETGIQDLHTLPGDFASAGLGINDTGRIVGASFDANFNSRAFLWQNGVMTDLNTLVPANSPLFLLFAHGINSRDEIVGFGVNSAGDIHAFLAIPRDLNPASTVPFDGVPESGRESTMQGPTPVLSENARSLLDQYLGASLSLRRAPITEILSRSIRRSSFIWSPAAFASKPHWSRMP